MSVQERLKLKKSLSEVSVKSGQDQTAPPKPRPVRTNPVQINTRAMDNICKQEKSCNIIYQLFAG
jgi:hypothetical protein